MEAPLNVVTIRLTTTGVVAPEQGGFGNFIIPAVFGFLLALSIIFSSTYLLQGLGEEKENRLMEILLSSVSTRQLITGKVLGIGAAGLTQVVVWVVSTPLLLNLAPSSIGGFISTIQIPANFLVLGIVYFILGYLLFAVLISWSRGRQHYGSRRARISIDIYALGICTILVHVFTYHVPEQSNLDCSQCFPLHCAGIGNVEAWFDRCSCVATSRQYIGAGIIHHRRVITNSQTAEGLYAHVREKARICRNYPKP